MSKNKSGRAEKIQRRKEAEKKAKQKKVMTIVFGVIAAAVAVVFVVLMIYRQGGERPAAPGLPFHVHDDRCAH